MGKNIAREGDWFCWVGWFMAFGFCDLCILFFLIVSVGFRWLNRWFLYVLF